MKVGRGCAGGPISAAGRHRRGACAAAGLSGSRRSVGAVFDAGSFASRLLCRRVIVVGYDFGREQGWDFVYEPLYLAFFVYCLADLAFILYWFSFFSDWDFIFYRCVFIFISWRCCRLQQAAGACAGIYPRVTGLRIEGPPEISATDAVAVAVPKEVAC